MEAEISWHFCIAAEDLKQDTISEVTADGKTLCLLRRNNTLYAFAATCPHAGARLCEGWIDAQGRVTCARHKYRFNPANGHNTSGEGYKLRIFPVKEEEGCIFAKF